MRRLSTIFFAMSLTLASTFSAFAATETFFTRGAWSAFTGVSDDNHPVCGMANHGPTQSFIIKYFLGEDSLAVQLFADHWRIPNGVAARVQVQIDNEAPWTATSSGFANGTISGLEFKIGIDDVDIFLQEIAKGNTLKVFFLDGNETPWQGGLTGSAATVSNFIQCVEVLGEVYGSNSQPYNSNPTQPFNPPATQPFTPPTSTPAPEVEVPLVNKMPVFGA